MRPPRYLSIARLLNIKDTDNADPGLRSGHAYRLIRRYRCSTATLGVRAAFQSLTRIYSATNGKSVIDYDTGW